MAAGHSDTDEQHQTAELTRGGGTLPASRLAAPVSGALAWLMAAHFTNDLYGNYLPALLPLLADVHRMTLGRAGLLIATLTASLLQPVFGHIADSTRLRTVAAVGLACSALGSALVGIAPSYLWLALATVLHGCGTAAFHPQSAGFVYLLSGARKGTRMAVYIMAGQAGQALGPLIAAFVAVRAGLPWVALTAVPALVIAIALVRVVPWHLRTAQRPGASMRLRDALRQNLGGLARLMGLIMSRAALSQCMIALLPFLFRARGAPATTLAAWVSGAVPASPDGAPLPRAGRRARS